MIRSTLMGDNALLPFYMGPDIYMGLLWTSDLLSVPRSKHNSCNSGIWRDHSLSPPFRQFDPSPSVPSPPKQMLQGPSNAPLIVLQSFPKTSRVPKRLDPAGTSLLLRSGGLKLELAPPIFSDTRPPPPGLSAGQGFLKRYNWFLRGS